MANSHQRHRRTAAPGPSDTDGKSGAETFFSYTSLGLLWGHSRRSRFGRESACPPISDMSGGCQIHRDVPNPDQDDLGSNAFEGLLMRSEVAALLYPLCS